MLGNGNCTTQCLPQNICQNLKFTGILNINNSYVMATAIPNCNLIANGIPNGKNGINGSGEQLYAWGRNDVGQLGVICDASAQLTPQTCAQTPFLDFSNMCNKSNHMLVLDCQNKLYGWGCNNVGQIGNNCLTNQFLPVAICSSCSFRYAAAYCCQVDVNAIYLSHAIGIDGKLYIWGCNHTGLIGDGSKQNKYVPTNVCPTCSFKHVYTDACSTYALTTDNKILTWGCNICGQLGNGNTTDTIFPTSVYPSCNFICLHVVNSQFVSSTYGTSVYALDANCKLFSWGSNLYGELGNNNTNPEYSPINICPSCTFMCVFGDDSYRSKGIFALTTDCKLFTWGTNSNNKLGNGDINALDVCVPTAICSSCTFKCVITCNDLVLAITTNNKLFGWGDNTFGRVGTGLVCSSNQISPGAICPSCDFIFVAINGSSTHALTTDCKLFSWGRNLDGNLGDGTTTSRCVPVSICPSCSFNCVYTRFGTTYATGIDGKLYAWGSNNCGQIGNGTTTNQCSPVNICPSLYFSCISPNLCGCGVIAIANSGTGTGGTGGTWSNFATLSCGTPGTEGVRGTGGAGGTITSATPGQSSIYYLT